MPTPKTINLRFCEIEHQGDLDPVIEDLGRSGAEILGHQLNEDAEEAVIRIRVPDLPTFLQRFKQTDSAGYCDTLDRLEVPCA